MTASTPVSADQATAIGTTPTWQRLTVHASVLWLVLLVAMPLLGTHRAPLISDEGALALQVDALLEERSWRLDHPLADIDPDGEFVAFGSARYADGELSPYASRPVYVALTAGLVTVAGVWGPVAFSTLGTAVAALLAALIARDVRPSASVAALWLTGVGTPLLSHGFVLQGHSIGAAATAAVVLAMTRAVDRPLRAAMPLALAIASVTAIAVTVRREFLFVAAGIALVAGVRWFAERRAAALMLALASTLGGAIGLVLERLLVARAFGTLEAPNVPALSEGASLVEGRIWATYQSMLRPSFDDLATLNLMVLIGLTAAVIGVAQLRRRDDPLLVIVGIMLMTIASALRITLSTEIPPMVPGLMMASPVAILGVALADPATSRLSSWRILLPITALVVAVTLAVQYTVDWNWGGRFFSVVLPLVAIMGAIGWTSTLERLQGRRGGALGAVLCANVAVMALTVLAVQHQARSTVEQIGSEIRSEVTDRTIVATTLAWIPRYDIDQIDRTDYDWAYSPPDRFAELLDLLAASDATNVIAVVQRGTDPDRFLTGETWNLDEVRTLPTLNTRTEMWLLVR